MAAELSASAIMSRLGGSSMINTLIAAFPVKDTFGGTDQLHLSHSFSQYSTGLLGSQ